MASDDDAIRFLDADREIACHRRSYGKGQRIEDPAHRASLLAQRRVAGDAKGRDRLHLVAQDIDVLYTRWVEAGRNLGSVTAHTIKLLDLYGDEIFATAVTEMVTRGTNDLGALQMICEQRRRALHRPIPANLEFGAHVPERDVAPHDLGVFDAKPTRRG